MGKEQGEGEKNEIKCEAPGQVKTVCKIPLALRHVFDLIYLITFKNTVGTNENTKDASRMKTYLSHS